MKRKYQIEYCLKKNTEIKEIQDEKLIGNRYLLDRISETNRIHNETGVPREDIELYLANWYKIGDEWYIFKAFDDFVHGFFSTLLGEKITTYFGLLSAHYEIARVTFQNNNYSIGLASKNFCLPEKNYSTRPDDLFPPLGEIYNLDSLKDYFESENAALLLLEDLKKLFVRDYLTGEVDRGGDFMLLEDEGIIRLAPLYDYEYSFTDESSYLKYQNMLASLNLLDKKTRDKLREDASFQDLFQKLLEINLENMLEEIVDTLRVKMQEGFRESVLDREAKVKKIVRDLKIVK